MSAPALILDSNLKAILDAGFEACFGGAPARYFSARELREEVEAAHKEMKKHFHA